MKRGKKGALELSVSTIVILVLAMTMLILGFFLVRSIMCGAINLTGDVNSKVSGEINKLFDSTGGEVICIGAGAEPIGLIPGKTNNVYCSVKASKTSQYQIDIKSMDGGILTQNEIEKWLVGSNSWTGNVAPGDEIPKKLVVLQIPDNAPQDTIRIDVEIKKDGSLISSQQLVFEIKRQGILSASIC